jgi:hypothetical protein
MYKVALLHGTTEVLHEEKEFADRFISYMLKRNVRIEADLVDLAFQFH